MLINTSVEPETDVNPQFRKKNKKKKFNLAGAQTADVLVLRCRETPGRGVEERRVHYERWAEASHLMGRFIIFHYQLIPLDGAGPQH